METYDILKFVHVLAAIVWVGGAVLFHVLAGRAVATEDPVRVQGLISDSAHLGKRYFSPAAITVLVFGVIAVLNGGYGFEHLWIVGGIVGIIASIVLGAGILGRTSEALEEHMKTSGLDDTVRAGLAKMRMVSSIDLLILVGVVFLMVVKPGS
jgi:uncharacterized membrane protein